MSGDLCCFDFQMEGHLVSFNSLEAFVCLVVVDVPREKRQGKLLHELTGAFVRVLSVRRAAVIGDRRDESGVKAVCCNRNEYIRWRRNARGRGLRALLRQQSDACKQQSLRQSTAVEAIVVESRTLARSSLAPLLSLADTCMNAGYGTAWFGLLTPRDTAAVPPRVCRPRLQNCAAGVGAVAVLVSDLFCFTIVVTSSV
jgi:hypothetical protein